MLKRISMVVLLTAVAASTLGQGRVGPPKPVDKDAAELQKLQMQFSAANRIYYKPYENVHTREEAAKIHLDPKKNPAIAYLPKFKALAKKAGRKPAAMEAWMMTKSLAEVTGNLKEVDLVSNEIMGKFVKSPLISQYVTVLPYSYPNLSPPMREKKISGILSKIEQLNPSSDVQAAAMYARAQLIARDGQGDTATAAKIFRELAAKYPNSASGKRARGDIFEMENLVVGKVAPDFDAEDQDGVKFKLSDYRGKVVVLDFWGFW